jgi:hypothetical protein
MAMASVGQINLKPLFKSTKVPCEGTAGDLLVLTPLGEAELDGSPQGLASLWFCTRSANLGESRPAIWKRVQFDGFSNCQMPDLPKPPQNSPPIREG